jgi:hypothetical protein
MSVRVALPLGTDVIAGYENFRCGRGLRRPSRRLTSGVELNNLYAAFSYTLAGALIELLKQCGNNLTRENIMRQAANLKGIKLPLLMPGIALNTSPDNYRTLAEGYLADFDGEKWTIFGDLVRGY